MKKIVTAAVVISTLSILMDYVFGCTQIKLIDVLFVFGFWFSILLVGSIQVRYLQNQTGTSQ